MASHEAISDLRRERDAIRVDMERVVRAMQELEKDLDAKKPGAEQRRQQLGEYRQELTELRTRMRRVMDKSQEQHAQAQQQSQNHSQQYGQTPSSGQPPRYATAAPGTPQPFNHASNVQRSVYKPQGGATPTATSRTASVAHQPHGTARDHVSNRSEQIMSQLRDRQAREHQQLEDEFRRLSDAMRQRHAHEQEQMAERLRRESERAREYEEACARMEQARRDLEELESQPTLLDDNSGAPEVSGLLNYR